MIALHHWRDNTVSALDAPHVCTAVVRHAKSAGDSNKGNGSSATQPQAKVPARPQRTPASKTTGHAPKARRAEAETKAQTKHGRGHDSRRYDSGNPRPDKRVQRLYRRQRR